MALNPNSCTGSEQTSEVSSQVGGLERNAVDLACSLVEDVDDCWTVVVDYGVVLFLGFFLACGSAFDDSWAGSVSAVR